MTQTKRVMVEKSNNALPLGVYAEKEKIRFSICLKKEDMPVNLILYVRENDEVLERISLEDYHVFGQVYALEVSGMDAASVAYGYVGKNGAIKDAYAPYVIDHSFIYGLTNPIYEWEHDDFLEANKQPVNDVVYKLHVRGFTKDVSSKVNHPGTFSGVIEKIPYLKDLGVTMVELMPVADFKEHCTRKIKGVIAGVPGQVPLTQNYVNYWGYGDAQYFAPKAGYSSGDAYHEFCAMVDAFHGNGIKVILEFYFVPGTSQAFVMDCLRYWVLNYHVDGFRINHEAAPSEDILNDPILANINLFVPGKQNAYGRERLYRSDDDFQNIIRCFLKGDEGCVDAFINAFTGMDYRGKSINYIASHNGFTLADLVSYNDKHNEANGEENTDGTEWNFSWNCGIEGDTDDVEILRLRQKQMRNAFVMLLLSAGTPMIMAGDEFGRSQKGNNNPYCQDNEISWLNWNDLEKNKDFYTFVKMLIQLKNEHPIFHHRKQYVMKDLNASGLPDLSFHGLKPWYVDELEKWYIGMMFHGEYAGKNNTFYLGFNMHWEGAKVSLPLPPKGKCWKKVVDTANWPQGRNDILTENRIYVAPRSIVILQSTEKIVDKVN